MLKISIITVSYNAASTIEKTILSVIGQVYPNIEYIVIDGGSPDGTVEIIRKYGEKIAYWVSEPDEGIYDAMNKGIRRATGDYLYFLGADDWLCDRQVMCKVSEFIRLHPGYVFYMGHVFQYQAALQLIKRECVKPSMDAIKHGVMCPHQGLFTRSDLMRSGFDTKYHVAADYAFLLRHIVDGATFCAMDIDVAYYSLFGASSDEAVYDEYMAIIKAYAGEVYLTRLYQLRARANGRQSWRKLLKMVVVEILGERNFFHLRGWRTFRSVN
ncbi:MAG: glycosyltransferase family 2 protein [Schwartzia sp. (in: firmicutes)]